MISFTSLEFIFRFLPIFLIVYYAVPSRFKNVVIIIGSLVFYAFGEPIFIGLLAILMFLNYFIATYEFKLNYTYKPESGGGVIKLSDLNSNKNGNKERISQGKRKPYMLCAVIVDILALVTFKILGGAVNQSLFPIGISFYIFKMLSFQFDVYSGEIDRKPGFIDTCAYFSLFPQITQGPIMRYNEASMDEPRRFTFYNLEDGIRYFIVGFAMKTLLADRIGILWNDLSMYGYQSISTPLAWLGAFAYSFELYFDFWGYSLMAEGLMVMMGFEFVKNFDNPYASKSISEFYRRWHVTLGRFFKEYVYFPLGGSRCDKKTMIMNLAIVWVLTGLWHGNGFNFLIWGIILGIFIVLEKTVYGKRLSEFRILGNIYVIIVIPLTWVVFAISDLKKLGIYFSRLFPFFGTDAVVNSKDFIQYIGDYWWMFIIAIVLCIPPVIEFFKKHSKNIIVTILLTIIFWISIYFSASSAANPFMYLNF